MTREQHRSEPDAERLLQLHRTMLTIRRVEETLMEVFTAGEIPGFLHVCIGQEAAPAAVCGLLAPEDYVGSTHRGHGHVLAKGIDLKLFMAELMGRRDGLCLGRSGSMHLAHRERGILGANGIVGAGIPVATGAAFAARRKYPGRVAVCFFGDGATDQGTFHECLNMAALWRLPVIYVCENNGWAEFSPRRVHAVEHDIAGRACSYGVPATVLENDALAIHAAAAAAIQRARAGEGPSLLEVKSLRCHGHFVGDPQKYRDPEEIERAFADDCLKRLQGQLRERGLLDDAQLAEVDGAIQSQIAHALEFARHSSPPAAEELAQGLYV